MNNYKICNRENSIFLEIFTSFQHKASLIFIAGVAITMLLIPILIILFIIKELSFGVILSWSLAWLISVFFMRLYLWNKYGKEVFIISDNNLKIYNDYKYFKENIRHYHFKNIDLLFYTNNTYTSITEIPNDNFLNDDYQLSSIIFKIDNDIVASHKEILVSEIFEIGKIMYQIRK